MEFRKMVMITQYAKQKKRHRCTEQTFGLCGRRRGGMFRENSIETSVLSRVKQITSPVWMHETSARAWCTGKTQRDGVEGEVGGGIGMGNTCKSWLIHVNVWQKPLQYCKVISLQLIKINKKKKVGVSQWDIRKWGRMQEQFFMMHRIVRGTAKHVAFLILVFKYQKKVQLIMMT